MYQGRMSAAWDVMSVVLAGIFNAHAGKAVANPATFHPVKSANREQIVEHEQRRSFGRIVAGFGKQQVVAASQVVVVPKKPRETETQP